MSNTAFSIFPNENFVDFSLYQFGQEKTAPAHSFGPATRNHYLFHYVISGTGRLYADDSSGETKEYQVKSGQGFMIFPGQINTYIADEKLPWEYVWIEFDGIRARESITTAGFSVDSPVYRAMFKEQREVMKDEMMYIVNNSTESPFHLIGHLYLFIDALIRSLSSINTEKGKRMQDYYIREALSYIEQNFQNDISVEDIASVCGINRSYFGKIFKEATDKTPQQFLITYRMIKATELLKLTKLSIHDISLAVGYENQLHFSRAFKNVYGVSPAIWRKENAIMHN